MHTYHTQKAGLETTRALAVKYGDVRLIFLFFIGENNEKTKKRGKRRKKAKNVVDNDGKEWCLAVFNYGKKNSNFLSV